MTDPFGVPVDGGRLGRSRGPRTLRARLALWISVSTGFSLIIFGLVAYEVVNIEEQREAAMTGQPEDSPADIRNEVLTALGFAAPVALVLAAAGALWLTRRTLAPVDQVIEAAREITAERLDRRLLAPDRDDELRAMVVALNGLLARLERGYQALSLFAADASHELRTPLAVIASELEVALRRQRSRAEWEASARTALDEVRRLSRLVDALLRLTRADAAGTGGHEPVDIRALVEQVVTGHAGHATSARIELEAGHGGRGGLAVVEGDRHALESALANLVGNAIRYTAPGGRVVVAIATSGDEVAIDVDDSGPGLEESELEAVFAPFARGASGRAADSGDPANVGLGLGLPIARRIAERHGGRLTATNRKEGGARFRLELPRAG